MPDVLLIDDDETILPLVQRALSKSAVQLTYSRLGREGLKVHQEKAFDLVLLDLNLPDLDGEEILRYIRRKDSSTPVILLTAEHSSHAIAPLLRLGVSNYIHKPFNTKELAKRVAAVLGTEETENPGAESAGPPHSGGRSSAAEPAQPGNRLAELVREHGPVFEKLHGKVDGLELAEVLMRDHHQGDWTRIGDWARTYMSEKGLLDSLPASLHGLFDFEGYAKKRIAANEVLVVELGPTLHVFADVHLAVVP